jgi:hypothetical protein
LVLGSRGPSEDKQRGGREGTGKGVKEGREGVGGKKKTEAGKDIACAGSFVQPSLNPGAGTGVWLGQGRSQESAITSTRSRWMSSVKAFRDVCGAVQSSWSGQVDWGKVVRAKRGWMERGTVVGRVVIQLNLSLRAGAGSTAQRLRVGLDLEGAVALSRSRVRRLHERRAARSVNVGQTQRERDRCDTPASPYPSPSHCAGAAVVCNSGARWHVRPI